MTKNCPLCNSTATDRGDTMYAKGGVYCDNMDCCLHTVGIPADEWNSRPIEDGLLARIHKAVEAEMKRLLNVDVKAAEDFVAKIKKDHDVHESAPVGTRGWPDDAELQQEPFIEDPAVTVEPHVENPKESVSDEIKEHIRIAEEAFREAEEEGLIEPGFNLNEFFESSDIEIGYNESEKKRPWWKFWGRK